MASPDDDVDLLAAISGETPDEAIAGESGEMEADATAGEQDLEAEQTTRKKSGGAPEAAGPSHKDGHADDDEEEEEMEQDEGDEGDDAAATARPRIPARPGICARFAIPSYDPELDVFLMVRRKKTTIFIDAKEDSTVLELKRMISGITKVLPEDQKLFRDSSELDDKKKISDYGLNAGTAKPQLPATISLVFKDENGEWEGVDIAPLSQPPELPEVMRQQESSVADTA